MKTNENPRNQRKSGRAIRGLAVAVAALVMSVGMGAVATQKAEATVFTASGTVEARVSCLSGHLAKRLTGSYSASIHYSGYGMNHVRVHKYVKGRGWMTGPWQNFSNPWTGDGAYIAAPGTAQPTNYLIYMEYRSWNQFSNRWDYTGEYILNENNTYWCYG